jgi:hypothetical protein
MEDREDLSQTHPYSYTAFMNRSDPKRQEPPSTRKTFQEQGYVVIENALGEETLEGLRNTVEELKPPCPGELHGLLAQAPQWVELLDIPTLLNPVLELLGSQIHLIHSSVASIPPGALSMVWHEDGPRPWPYPAVNGARPLILLRIGIPLDMEDGQHRRRLVVIPGSHKHPFPHPDEAHLLWERDDVREVKVPPRGAVIFHNGLWHTTAPNTMTTSKRQVYLVFAPLWHKQLDYKEPPEALLNAIEKLEESRRGTLKQLVGVEGELGPIGSMFPEEKDTPLLQRLQPEVPASGA